MTLRRYFSTIGYGRLCFIGFCGWSAGIVLGNLLQVIVSHVRGDRSDGIFTGVVLFAPALLGWVLAATIQVVQQRPFAMMLPGARRKFVRWHFITTVCAAIFCACVGHWILPAPVLFCIAVAGLSLALPLDSGGRWSRSRLLGATIGGALLLAGVFPSALRQGIDSSPWIASLLGLGIATACFALGFSREQLRWRALMSKGSTADSIAIAGKIAWRGAQAPNNRIGRRWKHGLVGNSVRSWLRVAAHERYALRRGGRGEYLLIWFLTWITFDVLLGVGASKTDASLTEKVYFVIAEPQTLQALPMSLLLVVFLLSASADIPSLRAEYLYPLSRARRALTIYVAAAMHTFFYGAGLILLATSVAWISATIAGLHFHPSAALYVIIAMLVGLPLIPIFQWVVLLFNGAILIGGRKGGLWTIAFITGGGNFVGFILTLMIQSNYETVLSPMGISICVLLVLASQTGFYLGLRRFFMNGDLL